MIKTAVILAGGLGTRLAPYTLTIPKPLVPICGEPIIEIIIRRLVAEGITDIHIALNHMASYISAFLGNGDKYNATIKYNHENMQLGTVGPLAQIDDLPNSFFVLNGDLLMNLSFKELFKSHQKANCQLTVGVNKREKNIDYGVIHLDENQNIVRFEEKPTIEYKVSMGVYVFEKNLINSIPKNKYFGFDQLIHQMIRQKLKINTYLHDGYWLDIGRPDDYERANRDYKSLQI